MYYLIIDSSLFTIHEIHYPAESDPGCTYIFYGSAYIAAAYVQGGGDLTDWWALLPPQA
jgi:hypothetical protein